MCLAGAAVGVQVGSWHALAVDGRSPDFFTVVGFSLGAYLSVLLLQDKTGSRRTRLTGWMTLLASWIVFTSASPWIAAVVALAAVVGRNRGAGVRMRTILAASWLAGCLLPGPGVLWTGDAWCVWVWAPFAACCVGGRLAHWAALALVAGSLWWLPAFGCMLSPVADTAVLTSLLTAGFVIECRLGSGAACLAAVAVCWLAAPLLAVGVGFFALLALVQHPGPCSGES